MYYPAMLCIEGKSCLVVGGGKVGARKCKELLECGAHVKVLSPEIGEDLAGLYSAGRLEWVKDSYSRHYMEGTFMCFACTDDAVVNKQVAADAAAYGVLINAADDPASSSFIVPSVRRKGSVTIAASCCDNPAATRFIADYLAGSLEYWMLGYIDIVHDIRMKCRALISDSNTRQDFMKGLFKAEMTAIAKIDLEAARKRAEELLIEYVRKAGN